MDDWIINILEKANSTSKPKSGWHTIPSLFPSHLWCPETPEREKLPEREYHGSFWDGKSSSSSFIEGRCFTPEIFPERHKLVIFWSFDFKKKEWGTFCSQPKQKDAEVYCGMDLKTIEIRTPADDLQQLLLFKCKCIYRALFWIPVTWYALTFVPAFEYLSFLLRCTFL